jgi:flagellar hook-associated protein 3 FlgL
MRISTAHRYDAAIANLQERQAKLAEGEIQLTSGKRVNDASDDPTSASRVERALAASARSDADKRSVDASRNVMSITEAAIGDSVELIQQAREGLVAAGNGSYTVGERKSLAIKLKEIRNQLLSIANRPDGGGGFVFGGQGSSAPPFVDTPNGVMFVGQGGETLASSGEKLNLTVDGEQVWLKARAGNGLYTTAAGTNVLTGQPNTGKAWINSGAVSTPSQVPYPAPSGTTPPSYSLAFQVSGGVTTYDIMEDGNAIALGQTYTSGQAITIPGKGMTITIMGQPDDGDSFAINEARNDLNVFSSLDKAINALNSGTSITMQAVNTGLIEMDSIRDNLVTARSAVGETLNRMDGIDNRISALKLASQTERSNAEDLDMTAAIAEFQTRQTGYDAALKSYAMVQKLSMFQYLNG